MNTIYAVFHPNHHPVDASVLDRMGDACPRATETGSKLWLENQAGLGISFPAAVHPDYRQHNLLEKTNLTIAARIRLDNREELISRLSIQNQSTQPIPDTEIVLAAYRRWGEQCPAYLYGEFAFFLWDQLQQTLFIARDHIGTRPVYYHASPRFFACASDLNCLLCLAKVPRQVNEDHIIDYLSGNFEDQSSTFYRHIKRLPPACTLTINAEKATLRSYWNLADAPEVRYPNSADYPQAFRELLLTAVAARLPAAQQTGLALSGGLDSTSICAAASAGFAGTSKRHLQTYSAIFPNIPSPLRDEVDERNFIHAAQEHLNLRGNVVQIAAGSPLGDLKFYTQIFRQPFFAPTLEIFHQVYASLQRNGVKVYLEGFDGDLTVSHGLERLAELLIRLEWPRLLSETRAYIRTNHVAVHPNRILWKYAFRPLIPGWIGTITARLRNSHRTENVMLRPDLRKRARPKVRRRQPVQNARLPIARKLHIDQLTTGIIPLGLEITEHLAAFHQLDVRYPFFDRRLMEFCIGLPADKKLSNGVTRNIHRQAMKNLLPDPIRLRTSKASFAPYFAHSLAVYENKNLSAIAKNKQAPIYSFIDPHQFKVMLDSFLANPRKNLAAAEKLATVLTINYWLEQNQPD